MKRILTIALTLAMLVSLGTSSTFSQSQDTITFGIVWFDYEATAWQVDRLIRVLEKDMEILPPPDAHNEGTALPQPPRSEPKVLFDYKIATTAQDQEAAIDAFVAEGVNGILLAPVQNTNDVVAAIRRANLNHVPVMIVNRPVPGAEGRLAAYIGIEPFQTGIGIAKGSIGRDRVTLEPRLKDYIAVASNLDDPRQRDLISGFEVQTPENYLGTILATPDNAGELVVAKIGDSINYVVVADPALARSVAEAVFELTEGTDRLVKIASFGKPEDWKDLLSDKLIHMVVTQDQYEMWQLAALELKMFTIAQEPLGSYYVSLQVWNSASYDRYMSYPYDYMRQRIFVLDAFWR